jgi:hypothetical protein
MRQNQIFIIAIISLLLFSLQNAFSQKSKITWSEELKETKGDVLGNLLKDDGEFIYFYVGNYKRKVWGNSSVTPGIMKFDYNMKTVLREDYTATVPDKVNLTFGGIFYCGGNFIMISNMHTKSTNTTEIQATKIDIKTLKPVGPAESIWKITAPKSKDFDWSFIVSDDSSKILLVAAYEQKDDEFKKFAYKVIDGNLKTVQERQVTLTQTVEKYQLNFRTVDNTGNVYFIGKAYFGSAKKEAKRNENNKKVSTYNLLVMRYAIDGKESSYNLEMGDKLLDNMWVQTDPVTDDMCIISTFSDTKQLGVISYGFYRLKATTGEILKSTTIKFPLPMIKKIQDFEHHMVSRAEEPSIPKTYTIISYKIMPDGRMYVILSNDFSQVVSTKNGSYTVYHSEGSIVSMLKSDGELAWMHYIPKRQFFNSLTCYLYQAQMVLDDKIVIFYNETEKNINYDWVNSTTEPKRFNELKEMSLMAVEITNEGKATRKEFANTEQMGLPTYINSSQQSNTRNFIIYGWDFRKSTNKIGLVRFEKGT